MNDIDRQIIEEIRRLKTALAISDRREVSAGLFAPSARGMNLMANGSGLLGTNYNLSSLTFDAVETHGGGGSFKATTGVTVLSDEYIAVDTTRYYRGVEWVKNGDADGTRYDAAAGHYGGSAAYDIDKNLIGAQHVMKHAGSTDTTLAVALNPGDTTMTLTNATGWNNGGVGIGDGYTRQVAWWPYLNSLGYAYPAYTYSRNHSGTYAAYSMYSTVGMWAPGGVSGNTVTLAAPWPGPALPIGTPIRNATSGGTYDYFISGSVKPAQNVWTRYEGTIGPLADPIGGWTSAFTFRPGTAFIKLLFLMNYSGYTTNNQRISDIWFSDMSAQNLEEATQTRIGVVGIGTQYFSGSKRWYVPTTVSYVVGGWFPSTGSYRTCFVNLGNPTTRIGFSMWNSSGVETIRLDPASTTFINTGGYVAIGKTSASYLLDVNGAVAATDLVISKTVAGAWAALEIRNSNSATNDTADITFKMTSAAVGPSAKISAVRVGASAITDLVFYTGEASTALVEALRIKNTTRWIGVGTSDPQTLLHTVLNSAIVNAPVEVQRIEARTSGVAGAGFGPAADFYGESATDGNYRQMGRIAATYATATDISRKAKLSFWAGDATALRLGLTIESDGAQALTKVGDGTTNYTQFDGSGHQTMVGTATVFNDEKGNLSSAKVTSPSSKVIQDDAESAYYFKNTATTADYLWLNIQFNHDRKLGSVTSPHLHWRQASATIPNWIIQYRWQKQGAAVTTAWTSIKWTSHAFTYTSGTLNQITDFNDITPPAGDGISDQLQVRIIRDTGNASGLFAGADGLAGDVYVTDFDTHKESDSLGSNSEYSK